MANNPGAYEYCNGLLSKALSSCPTIYYIQGSISGLAAASGPLLLTNSILGNTSGTIPISPPDNAFTFTAGNGARYTVSVASAPPGMSCSVSNGSGTIQHANVSNVEVACSCLVSSLGYSTCTPSLGSAYPNGENAHLGYDINAATGNLFLAQPDIHVHPALGPDLDFVRYYNSQGSGTDVGIGTN